MVLSSSGHLLSLALYLQFFFIVLSHQAKYDVDDISQSRIAALYVWLHRRLDVGVESLVLYILGI